MAGERVQRRLAAILAIDVVGYSRLMEADEGGTLARLKALRSAIIDPEVARHSGRMVKLMGDGALIEFGSAVDAVTCAMDIQKRYPSTMPQFSRAADPVPHRHQCRRRHRRWRRHLWRRRQRRGADRGLAEPGGIYISRSAADQVRDKIAVGIEEPRDADAEEHRAARRDLLRRSDGEPAIASTSAGGRAGRSGQDVDCRARLQQHERRRGQEYFSDGISEDIITDLSKLSDLHVIARNSSFIYKGKPGLGAGGRDARSACATCSKAACARPATGCASPRS